MTNSFEPFWDSFGYELSIPARRLRPADVVDIAASADRAGWSGVWLSEVLSLDAAVLLGAVAQTSPALRLGTSIVPVSTRSAALLAMMGATVEGLAPGRFALGLGVSTPTIVEERHDRALARPVASTRGVLTVVRHALRGDVVDHPADPKVSRLRVDAPAAPPPVLLAALGPRMVQVAYEHADGLILNLVPLTIAADLAQEGRRVSGPGYATLLSQRVCVSPTEEDLLSIRREIASYCRVGVYAANLARSGWDLEKLQAAPADEAAGLLPEDLLHELVILGSAQECRNRIDAIAAAGVRPVVVPVGAGDPARKLLAGFHAGR
ncbi:MAG: class F420-dependent oxidoreductase [Blastococcus sp.]|jgi:alkanesulfonate monooxygenase SsuD/methylene tetrahydromethanopterin reductase-like flavin-dependent oxidoreductase (luciferase family)|nr:class F420-dependent oxidoreductase [Blastococcus sp.]